MNTLLLVTLLAVGQGESVDTPATDEREIAKLLHPFFVQQAASYGFSLGSDSARKLTLVREPVLIWQSEESWSGDVFVWTYKGRPELIGCFGSWDAGHGQRGMFHEFHSLSTELVSAVRIGDRHTWAPEKPGLVFQIIPGAPVPAATTRLRSLQMRALAREFSATMKIERGMQILRMQSPMNSYTAESGEEGAIFPFVWSVGTDPEVLLVLEMRSTADGMKWMYAPVRFTYHEVWVQHQDKQVWHVEEHQEMYETLELKDPYATIRVEDVTVAELREQVQKATASGEAVD